MQSLGSVTLEQLKGAVQEPRLKFEVFHDGAWVDVCNLGGKNYLESLGMSLGGARMSPEPVAGTWQASVNNEGGIFHPRNPEAAHKDLFSTGKRVRLSTGGIYGGVETYWTRMIGVMESPDFSADPNRVRLKGKDLSQALVDYRLRSPETYWGDSVIISTEGPTETLGAEGYGEGDACEIGEGEAANVAGWAAAVTALSSVADTGGGSAFAMRILFGTSMISKVYSTPGTYQWKCPPGVTSVTVECLGGGGGGGRGGITSGAGGDGGGGGAYSKKLNIAVTPGELYTVEVGAGGNSDTTGGDTWFKSLITVLAKGGQHGQHHDGGFALGKGGQASAGVGDVKFSGGDGAGNALNAGGGAGSSAGTAANGAAGLVPTVPEVGGAGGTAPAGGGNGGKGGNIDRDGNIGSAPGGGGGGAGRGSSTIKKGGKGAGGKIILTYAGVYDTDSVINTGVLEVTAGLAYKVAFKYRRVSGPGLLAVRAYIATARQDGEAVDLESDSWTEGSFYFTATRTGDLDLRLDITDAATGTEFRVDQISIKPVTAVVYARNYSLPEPCTGIYFATLNGQMIFYGEDPDGYFYDAEHNELVFHPNRKVASGTDNLIVYYHTAQVPEHVVADILVRARLYSQRADALAAMSYVETGIVLERVWFEAGSSGLAAIGKICERLNYRFHFRYDGTPVFVPEPTVKAAGAEDVALEEWQIGGARLYEDAGEIWNDIHIKGENIAQPLGTEQTMDSSYSGSAVDEDSIAKYGIKTKSISNHLFQSDSICASMAAIYLMARKTGRKYFDLPSPINALPIEVGDTVRVQEQITPYTGGGVVYDDGSVYDGGAVYEGGGITLVHRGLVRDIKLSNSDAKYALELAD